MIGKLYLCNRHLLEPWTHGQNLWLRPESLYSVNLRRDPYEFARLLQIRIGTGI